MRLGHRMADGCDEILLIVEGIGVARDLENCPWSKQRRVADAFISDLPALDFFGSNLR